MLADPRITLHSTENVLKRRTSFGWPETGTILHMPACSHSSGEILHLQVCWTYQLLASLSTANARVDGNHRGAEDHSLVALSSVYCTSAPGTLAKA